MKQTLLAASILGILYQWYIEDKIKKAAQLQNKKLEIEWEAELKDMGEVL